MPLYRELWVLSGTKLSKRAEKMLKTTLVLEDQSCQQMIKMWKRCELWWRKTAEWVSGWLQKIQAWIKMQKDFENWSSESERTLQTTGCCTTIMRQLTLRFQFENFWRRKTFHTSTSSLQPRSSSVRFLPLLQVETEIEGSSFWDDGKHTKSCNRWATHTYRKWLPVLLPTVEKTLEPLCNFPRVILWRRQLVISGESNRHLNKKSVHLLLGQTSYVGPQNGTCLIPPFWYLQFWGGP